MSGRSSRVSGVSSRMCGVSRMFEVSGRLGCLVSGVEETCMRGRQQHPGCLTDALPGAGVRP